VVLIGQQEGATLAYPDTLVGLDSHTTMINRLGVVGWGVGGIEAEAVMQGQPISFLIPNVVGVKLSGELAEGVTATDLVLTITQMLLAKRTVERGLMVKPWVKTSLAPGSKVVTDYLKETGLIVPLEALRFHVAGYGCYDLYRQQRSASRASGTGHHVG